MIIERKKKKKYDKSSNDVYTIPNSEKKKYFQRIASPVSRGWNESNLIGWSRRHRANCKRFLQARRGRKNKASAIEWPVIFKWTVATHPRVWNSVWLSRNIYTSPPIVFTLLPSATKSKPRAFRAFARRKFQIVFPPSPSLFCFCFFFSHFYFYFFYFFSSTFQVNICLEDSPLDPPPAKSWNNSDYRLMRGSNHFDFESIPDLF